MNIVEQVSSVVGRIKDLMTEAGLKEPVFQKGMFTVKLFRPIKISEKTREIIINASKENKEITTSALAHIEGIAEKTEYKTPTLTHKSSNRDFKHYWKMDFVTDFFYKLNSGN